MHLCELHLTLLLKGMLSHARWQLRLVHLASTIDDGHLGMFSVLHCQGCVSGTSITILEQS